MSSSKLSAGQKIQIDKKKESLIVPDNPIIPFIEGDGTGPDIWRASVRVFDAAVEKAYGSRRRIRHARPVTCVPGGKDVLNAPKSIPGWNRTCAYPGSCEQSPRFRTLAAD